MTDTTTAASEPSRAVGAPVERPVRPHPLDDEHPYTYASTQATNCAGCGEYKHTPLRIDAMGGYVCLTCIDRKLGTLLGEFGCPAPQQALTEDDIKDACAGIYLSDHGGRGTQSYDVAVARAVEQAHGIGA